MRRLLLPARPQPRALFPAKITPSLRMEADGPTWQDSARTTTAGIGNPVGSADDQSGNGRHLQQTTAGARPTLVMVDGAKALRCDGTDDYLTATIPTASARTVLVVLRKRSAPTAVSRAATAFAPNSQIAITNSSVASGGYRYFANQAGSGVNYVSDALSWNVLSYVYTSTSAVEIRVNGGPAVASFDPGDDFSTATAVFIGANSGPGSFSDHDVRSLVVADSALSPGDHDLVGRYLAAKYGTAWSAVS